MLATQAWGQYLAWSHAMYILACTRVAVDNVCSLLCRMTCSGPLTQAAGVNIPAYPFATGPGTWILTHFMVPMQQGPGGTCAFGCTYQLSLWTIDANTKGMEKVTAAYPFCRTAGWQAPLRNFLKKAFRPAALVQRP